MIALGVQRTAMSIISNAQQQEILNAQRTVDWRVFHRFQRFRRRPGKRKREEDGRGRTTKACPRPRMETPAILRTFTYNLKSAMIWSKCRDVGAFVGGTTCRFGFVCGPPKICGYYVGLWEEKVHFEEGAGGSDVHLFSAKQSIQPPSTNPKNERHGSRERARCLKPACLPGRYL